MLILRGIVAISFGLMLIFTVTPAEAKHKSHRRSKHHRSEHHHHHKHHHHHSSSSSSSSSSDTGASGTRESRDWLLNQVI